MNRISGRNWRASAPLIAGLLFVIAPYRASGQAGPAESPAGYWDYFGDFTGYILNNVCQSTVCH